MMRPTPSMYLMGILLLTCVSVAQVPGAWTATGSMATPRYAFTAVPLPDGRVLAAGGLGSTGALASAELFEPLTGTWSPAGNMKVARAYYVATRLRNGKVLVAGGCTNTNCSAATATAEIYDPATGVWRAAGRMSMLRYFFAATVLKDGTVLVEGGCNKVNCGTVTTAAELFNPQTGRWTLTGNLKIARDYHTASALQNGKVLVIGGYTITGGSNSVELYDPTTGTWTSVASMISGRALHSATTLFDGRVVVAGGVVGYLPGDVSEVYDPGVNSWSATGNLNIKRAGPSSVRLKNGAVMLAGGYSYTRPYYFDLASCESLDVTASTWALVGDMTSRRYLHALTLLPDGRVLAAGGLSDNSTILANAELYTP